MINQTVRKFSFQSCTLSAAEAGFTHQPLHLSSQSCVSHFWFLQIQRVESNLRKYFTPSACSQPETSKGNDKHRLHRVKGKESRANPESSPWAKDTEELFWDTRCHLGLHSSNFKTGTFWSKLFYLPAQVPSLEPGSKLQSYRIQAWNYECLISIGLDFVYLQSRAEGQIPHFSPPKKDPFERWTVFLSG